MSQVNTIKYCNNLINAYCNNLITNIAYCNNLITNTAYCNNLINRWQLKDFIAYLVKFSLEK